MNCNLHIVCIGVRHHFIHMVSGKKAEAPVVCFSGIRNGQICRAAAQCTVSQHFERSDPEEVTPGACYISGFHKCFQVCKGCNITLLINPHCQFSGFFQLAIGTIDLFKRDGTKDTVIIRLRTGNPIGIECSARKPYHLLQIFHLGKGHRSSQQVNSVVIQSAVGDSVFHADFSTIRRWCCSGNPRQLQSLGIHNTAMTACSRDNNRDIC